MLQTAPPPAIVQPAPADVDRRLAEIVALLSGKGDYAATFGERFRSEVPKARFDALAAQIAAGLGKPKGVERIDRANALEATATIGYERGRIGVALTLMPGGTRQVAGFSITGSAPRQDSFAAIVAEAAKLPGTVGFGVYALEDPAPRALAEHRGEAAAPIGSAFKLWVLAELAAQVAEGKHRWEDVAPLAPASLPSGITQGWPAGTPMTLQSLATLMIAISDNTATDTLIGVLGREAVDARAAALGADRLPVLTTAEAFRLKHPAAAALAASWAALTPDERRARLADPALAKVPLDPALFGDTAVRPEIEWFASPRGITKALDWLSRKGGPIALAILATPRADPHGLAYLGYKGGSEPGVLSFNHLARDAQGKWYAVIASQYRADAAVDPGALGNLSARALDLLGARR
ncbi:serine hydrolase [Sphingomonas yantingensis]|uniref:Beta-lactamase class A n=1 Tax=Sphingomonas yantingensis TaxID=1241761 RepID=A0A7W9AS01_9SPHN|nr:serine hydrolase [Sphingomonas yantingensis]MBB5699505.1 beta-lactamase class A [Sphingomonas yantingensis]